MNLYLGPTKTVKGSEVLRLLKGEASALLVWVALAERARPRGEAFYCWPSLKRLREDTGLSIPTVKRALLVLEQKEMVVRTWKAELGFKSKITILKV